MSEKNLRQELTEYPAVKTTIVGGRPPGSGKMLGAIPRGIEVLVKKASVDPAFKSLLMSVRSKAADEIGLALDAAEADALPPAAASVTNTLRWRLAVVATAG